MCTWATNVFNTNLVFMSEYILLIFVCKIVKTGELIAFLSAKFSTVQVSGGVTALGTVGHDVILSSFVSTNV
jgi:hypothetical protein